jgi:hypothetical protein
MIIYDFDQTIPSSHIFHATGGAAEVGEFEDDFFIDAFGGEERILRLQAHFFRLKKRGIELLILSHGWSGVIMESLERMGLSEFFASENIFGNESDLMTQNRGEKQPAIQELMRDRHLQFEQVLFVDDDWMVVEQCKNSETCRTLHVEAEAGLTENELITIENAFSPS